MKKRFMCGVASIVLLVALGICVTANDKPAARPVDEPKGKSEVAIDNFSFMPDALTVPAGTIVTWVNHDDVPHTVASNDNKFRSRALDTEEQFSYTFTDAGTYEYYCSIHPKMTAKVIVRSGKKVEGKAGATSARNESDVRLLLLFFRLVTSGATS